MSLANPCPFCNRRESTVRVSARGDIGRSSTYSCGPCAHGPATDWNTDNGVSDVEIVALPQRQEPTPPEPTLLGLLAEQGEGRGPGPGWRVGRG